MAIYISMTIFKVEVIMEIRLLPANAFLTTDVIVSTCLFEMQHIQSLFDIVLIQRIFQRLTNIGKII